MEILQLRILSYEEVKQDVTSVSTKVNELWTTLEETMKDVELEKEQSR